MSMAAISSGAHMHGHLDHLAPLCHFLNMPLITDDDHTATLCNRFYPQISLIPFETTEIPLHFLVENFDTIFSSVKMTNDRLKELFKLLFTKEMRLIYCPHGNSDKPNHFQKGDTTLVYGKQMLERLQNQQVKTILCGNYRYHFYQKFQSLYDKIVQKEIFAHLPLLPTILYAPTWDAEDFTKEILRQIPPTYNLIIKPHPFQKTLVRSEKPNVLILRDFPLIYPLLSRINIYLGDFSSIGYDFLAFNRPMFFFNKGSFLGQCGIEIPSTDILTFIQQDQRQLEVLRRRIYSYAFEPFTNFGDGNIKGNSKQRSRNGTSED